jgi:hypothetical protein
LIVTSSTANKEQKSALSKMAKALAKSMAGEVKIVSDDSIDGLPK